MPAIHQTAVVDDGAGLADDVIVGPFCVIGPNVKLGSRVHLHSHVVLDGPLTVGAGTEIFPNAVLGKRTQDLKYKGGEGPVRIGANCIIREHVTMHQPTEPDGLTAIGDGCSILAYSHVAHDCVVGNGVIMSNSTNLAGHVIIEDDVVFGGIGGAHQFVRIGRGAMIGAMAKVVQDVAPYCLVEGNPAWPRSVNRVGMQRHGAAPENIQAVQQSFKLLFRAGLRLEQAIERMRAEFGDDPWVMSLVEFLEQPSGRGLARPRKNEKSEMDYD